MRYLGRIVLSIFIISLCVINVTIVHAGLALMPERAWNWIIAYLIIIPTVSLAIIGLLAIWRK